MTATSSIYKANSNTEVANSDGTKHKKNGPHPSYQHFKGNPINYLERRLIILTLRNKVFTTFALKQPVTG